MTGFGLHRIAVLAVLASSAMAGERTIVSLRNFCETELKSAGFDLPRRTIFHVRALGAGAEKGWTYSSNDLFAYGWIINASTRELVWEMDAGNTHEANGERVFDDDVTLDSGSYEVYFTVPVFVHHTFFSHIMTNVDHRRTPLFGGRGEGKKMTEFFKNWFSDDVVDAWQKRCRQWGIDLVAAGDAAQGIGMFTPPRALPRVLLQATAVGENALIRKAFTLSEPVTLSVYALGERGNEGEMADFGWIVDASTRKRVWEMKDDNVTAAGGADKNVLFHGQLRLSPGQYVLYYNSDDSHSSADWNSPPPHDPLYWGITVMAASDADAKAIREVPYQEMQNVVVSLTKVKNNESRMEGFTLKRGARVRVYAIGERSNSRRLMADYGFILDARTRTKVWTMDVDRTSDAGGASKNRFIDEIITLPAGSYLVGYVTDDSHAWGDWNAAPPGDADHYGITVMTLEPPGGLAEPYIEKKDRNVIARIVRVRDDANLVESFRLDRTTRVRIYAIGEGQNREMYDYGWIEDARSGNIVWEMTYGMTFHAGGHRKNRMVNTTILLDKGEYRLHYVSDDSHSYGDWNVDPPEDQESWGITLYRDDAQPAPEAPEPPAPPPPKKPAR